ncbi:MAG: hypothetical protein ACP5GU_05750 [Thermoprotei archaeon]|jgi:2-methylcitrate dehydratase PrpD
MSNIREFLIEVSNWVHDLSIKKIPLDSISHAKILFVDTLGAAIASLTTTHGKTLVSGFYNNINDIPIILPALSILLDFDSTLLYYGHLGHGILASALYYAISNETTGSEIIEAIVGASEITSRIAASLALSETRGQMMMPLHALSTAIMLAKLSDQDPNTIVNAINHATSILLKPLREGFATISKTLIAFTGFNHGLNSFNLAKAVKSDNNLSFESFLKNWKGIIVKAPYGGLGKRWHINTLSIKKYPACSYAQTAIEAILQIRENINPSEITQITVKENLLTYHMDKTSEVLIRKGLRFPILQFFTPYLISYTLIHGKPDPLIYEKEYIQDRDIWNLIAKTKFVHNLNLTSKLLKEPLPFSIAFKELNIPTKLYLLSRFGGLKALIMLRYPEIRKGRNIESIDLDRTKKILGVEIEVKTSTTKYETRREIVDGFHGTGLDKKWVVAFSKLSYLKMFISDDEFQHVVDILRNLEKADYGELNFIVRVIKKALERSVKSA